MEAATTMVVRSSFGISWPSNPISKSGFAAVNRPCFVGLFVRPQLFVKHHYTVYGSKTTHRQIDYKSRRNIVVGASSSSESASSIAPLKLKSPVGQFLSQILISHPHLVPAAVDQQLEQLQTDRDAAKWKDEPAIPATDLVLYRRISEVKEKERRRALEEILYALIAEKFMEANVPLMPSIAPPSTDPTSRVNGWPAENEKLERLHSPEAYEMIQNHLGLILGNKLGDTTSVAKISKFRVGQVYAASVMYGYFLKRVDQRFQLEKSMKFLPNVSDAGGHGICDDQIASAATDLHGGPKASRLRSYVMNFDVETLQRYAEIRSEEAVIIIEKHTEALFGRSEIVITPRGTVDSSKDELVKISFGGLKRLVLEAITFGSFLWDVESYVDSRYRFVAN